MCKDCATHNEVRHALDKALAKLPYQRDPHINFDHPYLELIAKIPNCLPDGTGILTADGWVKWAKQKLGYQPE